jgi:uncharacterized membrane protein YhiD involved in acid resistance
MSAADEVFQRLGLALAIGLLVGLERGWKPARRRKAGGLPDFEHMG